MTQFTRSETGIRRRVREEEKVEPVRSDDPERAERHDDPVESGALEGEQEGDLEMPPQPQEEPAESGGLEDPDER